MVAIMQKTKESASWTCKESPLGQADTGRATMRSVGRKRDSAEVRAIRKARGLFLRAARESLGLTQGGLATTCEIDPSIVSRIEAGSIGGGDDVALLVSRALGLDPAEFYAGRRLEAPATVLLDGLVLATGELVSPSAAARAGLSTPPRARGGFEAVALPVAQALDGFAVRLAIDGAVQVGGDGPGHDLRPGDVLILRWLARDEVVPEGALVYATRAEDDGSVVGGELRLHFTARRIPRLAAIVGDDEVRLDAGWRVEAVVVEQRRALA